jgi:hypothetical protein
MRKANKFSRSFIAFAMMLLFSPCVWSQSAAPSTRSSSVTQQSVSAGPATKNSRTVEMTAADAYRAYAQQHPGVGDADPQYSLLRTKATLENGQKNNSLSASEVTALQNKISSLEIQVKKGDADKSITLNRILVNKATNRAEFLSLNSDQQRRALQVQGGLTITDLVNEKSANPQPLQNGYYVSEDNFRNSDIMKQIYVLQNPGTYKIVKNGTVLPKAQISREQFNQLPEARRQHILESNQYEITN